MGQTVIKIETWLVRVLLTVCAQSRQCCRIKEPQLSDMDVSNTRTMKHIFTWLGNLAAFAGTLASADVMTGAQP
jgi:hypothetical protein